MLFPGLPTLVSVTNDVELLECYPLQPRFSALFLSEKSSAVRSTPIFFPAMPGFVIRIRPSSWHVFITNHSSHPEYVSNWVKGWLGCIIQYVEAEQITPWPITSALTEATYPEPLSSVPPLRSHSSSVIRVVYAIDEGVSGCHGVDARISNSPSRSRARTGKTAMSMRHPTGGIL